MYSAAFEVRGNNYRIVSKPIQVPNMQAELNKLCKFAKDRGGTQRSHDSWISQAHEIFGYYNFFNFESEFFMEGIIIDLQGRTMKDRSYFVNPSRRNLHRDLRGPGGVCLADIDEYQSYEQERAMGLVEQTPSIEDEGIISLTLEGAVRHLSQDAPEFYAFTGLPKEWPIPLRLINPK